MPEKIIVYGTPICPMVPPVRGMLSQSDVDYDYIDISKDTGSRERVQQINSGNESVPTIEFPDGSTLTEPSLGELERKLKSLGYDVPFRAKLMGMLPMLLFALIIVWAALRFLGFL